jgi:CHAD domain-containing protein
MVPNPSTLIDVRLRELSTMMPAVRTADVDAVHDARILTRRLRELLPLARKSAAIGEAVERVAHAGRTLGEVRELDVLEAMLGSLDTRARFAAATIADVRRDVRDRQCQARRQMVKTLEQCDLDELVRRSPFRRSQASGVWARALRDRIGRRAERVREACRRAGGVYMANRSHRARIAIKKLRYAVEIAAETQRWSPPAGVLKDLRRAQSTLGDLHDLQVLVERVEHLPAGDAGRTREVEWLIDLLRADIETGHRAFVRRLPKVQQAVGECERWSGRRPSVAWPQRISSVLKVAAASAMVVPTVLDAIDRVRSRTRSKVPAAGDRGADSHAPIRAV